MTALAAGVATGTTDNNSSASRDQTRKGVVLPMGDGIPVPTPVVVTPGSVNFG